MAIITDIELTAGFQVRVRWYAQATQRYPANENEYYSTFFTSLEPNSTFQLSDPRFDVMNINDDPANLQYVIRDVCHTQTLVPQFVDFIYINPDYRVSTVLAARVDGGSETITVDANPDGNFSNDTISAGTLIQIGPIQSDVYYVQSVSGTTITLGTGPDASGRFYPATTTKTFPIDSIVALYENVVSGTYPDTSPETALARILDNTGSLFTGTIQVTTPLYYDIGETVRRFYYDSALQTPFNGARGSGDTENIVVIDPRDITKEIEAGWWAAGDTDNEAAEEACLIDSEGFLIAKRDREHAFDAVLYYAERETAACTTLDEGFYLANHPDFTDVGFTSIRNSDGANSIPKEGFYAWSSPTIIFTSSMVSIFWGDNQYRPGYTVVPSDDHDSIFFQQDGLQGSITFSGMLNGVSIQFTVDDTAMTPAGALLADITDKWEIDRATITEVAGLMDGDNGLLELIVYPDSSERSFAVNRFVRYWNPEAAGGPAFDAGRVHPSLLIDNCPSRLSNDTNIEFYSSQSAAACEIGGQSLEVWFYTVTGDTFGAGNVTGIFTDAFGPNSDVPSALGIGYVRFGGVVFFWNGNSLEVQNDPCSALFCNNMAAVNFGQDINGNPVPTDTGFPDENQCILPQPYCNVEGATNYNPNPGQYDVADPNVCEYPSYNVNVTRTSTGVTDPFNAVRYQENGEGNYGVDTRYEVNVVVALISGYEWEGGNSPQVSYDDGNQTGGPFSSGTQITVPYTVGTATVVETGNDPLPPTIGYQVYTGKYATDQTTLCNGGGTDVTAYYTKNISLGVGGFLSSSPDGFNSDGHIQEGFVSVSDGWYTTSTATFRVESGQVLEFNVACDSGNVDPPVTPVQVPSYSSPLAGAYDITVTTGFTDFTSITVSVLDPNLAVTNVEWSFSGGQSSNFGFGFVPPLYLGGSSTANIFFNGNGGDTTTLTATIIYTDENGNSQTGPSTSATLTGVV